MSVLTLDGLGLRRGEHWCLRALDLQLAAGEVVCLLGPNGAGKSSVLRAASGEWEASTGRVSLLGRTLSHWPDIERARRLAVLPQSSALSFPFHVRDVVALGRMPHASGRECDAQIVSQAMTAVGIQALADKLYPQLSGGERQRVQLARVLSQVWPDEQGGQDRVLLLDEPTAALDWAHQLELLGLLRRLAEQGLAILLVLHDLNLALRYADRVVLLHEGEVYGQGVPEQVLTPQAVQAVFGVPVVRARHPVDDGLVLMH